MATGCSRPRVHTRFHTCSRTQMLIAIFAVTTVTQPVSDWDRRNVCYPAHFEHPSTVAEVQKIVRATGGHGQLKVIGAGHSFSPCMLTEDPAAIMINLDKLNALLTPPTSAQPFVRVEAGMRLHTLNAKLHGLGFAMENLGASKNARSGRKWSPPEPAFTMPTPCAPPCRWQSPSSRLPARRRRARTAPAASSARCRLRSSRSHSCSPTLRSSK